MRRSIGRPPPAGSACGRSASPPVRCRASPAAPPAPSSSNSSKCVDVPLHEATEQDVVLVRPAMGGAIQQAAAPRIAARHGSGSLIGAVSYSRATTPCQPVDHDPLTPLFSPLTTLKGVGPAVGALIAKAAGGERVIDLLFHLPESYAGPPRSGRRSRRRGQARSPRWRSRWCGIEPPANARQPWRVVVTDGTGVRRTGVLQVQPASGRCRSGAKLLVSGQDRAVQRPAARCRIPSTWCRRTGRTCCRRSSRSGR